MRVFLCAALAMLPSIADATMVRADRALNREIGDRSAYMPKHGRYSVQGRFTVDLLAFEEVQRICPAPTNPRGFVFACVDCKARLITIVEPTDIRIRYAFREVFEHEPSHCSGYRHPG